MTFRTLSAYSFALLLGAATLSACDDDTEKPATGTLNVELENVVGSQPLTLGQSYSTLAGDQITVSKFNYIISNIKLTRDNGTVWAEPESYHLVKQAETASRSFAIKDIPTGYYTKLTFTIGVDSARNTAGAQTGALAPDNDMYWSWNSGYIFLKLEGTSPQSSNGQIVYHVGGFRTPYNTIRTVSPALPAGTASLAISKDKTPQLHLKADVQKIFTGPTTIRLSQLSATSHMPDAKSVQLANNYAAGLFSIDHIHTGE
ncbi:hypothetical protein EJV47_25080 [Hymenobacter gummosus]|uniref:Copper-binding protein MbnP-like domain-containing protein n=1 Tax=Hymenobacter gummosus TaxID=1776032 RepID=A0A431TVS6_9BACT|nr:MbnP family protein [Hymenobacter gummosus]RTQ45417.1 hypothetical protein EJV47_25080 [Hymenobacter gummosus]